MNEKTSGRAIVAIGTNVPFNGLAGSALVNAALQRLGAHGFAVVAVSTHRQTPAWPDPSEPPYTNAVAILDAPGMGAQAVMAALLDVESAFGRVRTVRNAPRTLDLDLLDLDGEVIAEPGLVLPHPRLQDRAFVLEPLAEIAPGWRHPVLGRTALEMWAALSAVA